MITRNWQGRIEPRIGKYVVERGVWDGKYRIKKDEGCIKTDAVLGTDIITLWNGIEPFDSMVKAYAWLKANVNELL